MKHIINISKKSLKLFLIIIFYLCVQSWTKADDVREFEIEGMSIGNSLLDYFSEKEILDNVSAAQYPNKKFILYFFKGLSKFKTYESVTVAVKANDKNFIIYDLGGSIYFEKNFEKCLSMMDEVDIACASPQDALRLLQASKEWHDRKTSEKIEVFRWCAANEYWRRESQVAPRRLDTVYIDETLKKDVLDDLQDFDSAVTREWYAQHCIPFRRGMLLHGPPGTGKTSLIVAIATQMQRAIYRVSLCAPKLCDDTLVSAMNNVRLKAIVVLEDIDALWGVHREKSELGANVTFSGLLNSLDSITEAKGTLFLFTTNHPEKLDPALRRCGRIDREFYLGPCSEHTARHMFECFYPDAQSEAAEFSKKLKPHRGVTTSQLQEHFISMRKHDAATAAREFEPQASDSSSGTMWG